MTELDQALEVARQNPSQANYFYDTFLNATLYIPAKRATEEESNWEQIKTTERFFPLYLRKGETRAVPVFDTMERMQEWAEPKLFDYIQLKGHLFLKVIAEDVHIVLNEGIAESRYHFTSEILEQLRTAVKPVLPS